MDKKYLDVTHTHIFQNKYNLHIMRLGFDPNLILLRGLVAKRDDDATLRENRLIMPAESYLSGELLKSLRVRDYFKPIKRYRIFSSE